MMEVRVIKDCILGPRYLRAGEIINVEMDAEQLPACLKPVKRNSGKRKAATSHTSGGEEVSTEEVRPKI